MNSSISSLISHFLLFQIIGRVEADPDYMPRNSDFSLNQQEFREKFCAHCPEAFVKVAFVCCDLNPDMRPCFETLHIWLEQLREHLAAQQQPPAGLLHEIENFQDSYISSEDALSPTSQRSLDNLSAVEMEMTGKAGKEQEHEEKENVDVEQVVMRAPQDIPKSPHLGKDFSPSGERLRDSMRARRRQRFLGAQQQLRGLTPETTSTERALKQALKKCRPFGEKGYLVDLRPGAELQLNDVRDLNNYSDVDSSCDTSLNYHEVNATTTPTPTSTPPPVHPPPVHPPPPTPPPLPPQIEHRLAFEDMRTRLHQCRSKFEHLEEANRRNFNQSQHSMRNFFKTPPVALKMFQRLEHEATLNGGSAAPTTRRTTTQRINQTPIFGRRQMPATLPQLQQAESLENLAVASTTNNTNNKPQIQPATKRSKAAAAATTLTCTAELHAPKAAVATTVATTAATTTLTTSSDYLPKKHKLTLPLRPPHNHNPNQSQSRVPGGSHKTKPLKQPSQNTTGNNCVSPSRVRPASPSKHLAQRHTAATAQRQNNHGKKTISFQICQVDNA